MPQTFRTFIAVHLHAGAALRPVLDALGRMGRAVRPAAADSLHVTLKFLGDTDAELIPTVAETLRECVAGREPFELRLVGLGAFPHPGRPSVVWAGIEDGAGDQALREVAAALETALEPHGFPREHGRNRFHPHLTLARIKFKPPPELAELFAQHAATDFGTQAVTQVTLYQSDLRPEGPLYTPLATVELAGETATDL